MLTPSLGRPCDESDWTNLSALIGELGLTDPDIDPSGVGVSISSDRTGTTITVKEDVAAGSGGFAEGALYVIADDIADVFPEWEYGRVLQVRGTLVTPPANGTAYFQTLGLVESGDTERGYAGGVLWTTGGLFMVQEETGGESAGLLAGSSTPGLGTLAHFLLSSGPGSVEAPLGFLSAAMAAVTGLGSENDDAAVTPFRLFVAAGSGGTSPPGSTASGKVLWEARVITW